jgi:hypothetical protein
MSKSLEQSKAVSKSKATVANAVKTLAWLVTGAERFVVAVSWTVVAVFCVTQLNHLTSKWTHFAVALSLAVVLVTAFFALAKVFIDAGKNKEN